MNIPTDDINTIMQTQLTEREVMVYLLIENNIAGQTGIGEALGVTKQAIQYTYSQAKKKMEKMAAAGLFQTEIQ